MPPFTVGSADSVFGFVILLRREGRHPPFTGGNPVIHMDRIQPFVALAPIRGLARQFIPFPGSFNVFTVRSGSPDDFSHCRSQRLEPPFTLPQDILRRFSLVDHRGR